MRIKLQPGQTLEDLIAKLRGQTAQAVPAAPPRFWTPPPEFKFDPEDSKQLGQLPLRDAIRFSKNKTAVGYLALGMVSEFFEHFVGCPAAVTNGVSVWLQMPNTYQGARNAWDDCFLVWDTMSEETREFLECLHWAPMHPMGPMEVLANASE